MARRRNKLKRSASLSIRKVPRFKERTFLLSRRGGSKRCKLARREAFGVNDGSMLPLWDTGKSRRFPGLTLLLIAACAALFAWEVYLAFFGSLEAFIHAWAVSPAQLWQERSPAAFGRIFSAVFLHGGPAHLLGNLWFLWLFGNRVEDRLGWFKYAGLFALGALLAAMAHAASMPSSTAPMVGASGAVSALLGAYVRLFPKAWVFTLTPLWFAPLVPLPAVLFMLVWFALQAWMGFGQLMGSAASAGVAWWAHLGGFAAGFLLLPRLKPRRS
jgi:membrane associated rhomboid family serine protease